MDYMQNMQNQNIPTRNDSPNLAFASLIIGGFSLLSFPFGLSIFIGALGLILALLSRGGNTNFLGTAIAGIIMNVLGIFIELILIVIIIWGIRHFGGADQFLNVLEKYSAIYTPNLFLSM